MVMFMEPLALKLRPKCLKEIIGQKHLIGENKIISNLIKNNHLFSMILYGKCGIGKTTMAYAIVNELKCDYVFFNAALNNKRDLDEAIYNAKLKNGLIIIMDEFHRLNKDKQDLLLPHLESGLITLIGLTTANPYHSVNPAIRSRCQIFELKSLSNDDIKDGLQQAVVELKDVTITEEAINYIVTLASGDLRYAYNLLEVAYYSSYDHNIDSSKIKEISNKPNLLIDKNADAYYDIISAFQKSIRGSDVNASLYYLALLIEAGDLDTIFRRLSVIAYEDIGLANTSIGPKLNACINACERVGLPEARIPLSVVVVEMALSPKSNSAYEALNKALNDIQKGNTGNIPKHLKNGSKDYKYPHNYKGSYVKQQYLPDEIKNRKYFVPKETSKFEQSLKNIYDKLNKY